ncbi:MAG: hypothetical protein WAV09_04240 [Minisyncoccia bacterium]
MAKYKNTSEETLTVPGIGEVVPGAVIEMAEDFHNGNFERVTGGGSKKAKESIEEVEDLQINKEDVK